MNYEQAAEWILKEDSFDADYLGKCEAIMCLGNGYLGLRSATEEKYSGEQRNLFIAGSFNKANENEVTELPNAADVIAMDFSINGEKFSLETGTIKEYERTLNIKTGELKRRILWTSPNGSEIELLFQRIVSMENLHVIAQKVTIKAINKDISFSLRTGINGRMTNSGAQHFMETEKRLYDKKYMQYVQTTSQSHIDFVLNSVVSFEKNGKELDVDRNIGMGRRYVYCDYFTNILAGEIVAFQKISNVYTSRDKENEGLKLKEIQNKSLEVLKDIEKAGYDLLLKKSAKQWEEKVWNNGAIEIESDNIIDQLAIRFAQYHLAVMTPAHDERMNIGAKGLSGEGYKGHTFWDTDIFVLPYFSFTFPEIAKKLLIYRYLTLDGARRKAKDNGFEGAQFPWESAWYDDGEVTPKDGDIDIVTGQPQKIWTGLIEQHITADIAFGIWQYYKCTKDQKFMDDFGYELIFDTAKFWNSRLELGEDGKYHINDVIGPDEYKEHIDDNAYTNYMAFWNIQRAVEYYEELINERINLWKELNKKLEIEALYEQWQEKLDKMFLPSPREDGVIPQDSTYLTLKEIDLTKYKEQEEVLGIYKDYNAEQINEIQVSKQADILILFYLLENYFTEEIKKANWNYYEPRTLHDSSLSLSTHCILANDVGDKEKAYDFFQKSCNIDMGPFMKSSDGGIHSASIGGIWQSVVFGFGGVRMLEGKLRIRPSLPDAWKKLKFTIMWHGQRLEVTITQNEVRVVNTTGTEIIEFEK